MIRRIKGVFCFLHHKVGLQPTCFLLCLKWFGVRISQRSVVWNLNHFLWTSKTDRRSGHEVIELYLAPWDYSNMTLVHDVQSVWFWTWLRDTSHVFTERTFVAFIAKKKKSFYFMKVCHLKISVDISFSSINSGCHVLSTLSNIC